MNTALGIKEFGCVWIIGKKKKRERESGKRNSRVCKSDFSLGWCDINGSGEGGGRPGALLGTFHILDVVKTSAEKGP